MAALQLGSWRISGGQVGVVGFRRNKPASRLERWYRRGTGCIVLCVQSVRARVQDGRPGRGRTHRHPL